VITMSLMSVNNRTTCDVKYLLIKQVSALEKEILEVDSDTRDMLKSLVRFGSCDC
jgi:hypothetical protein